MSLSSGAYFSSHSTVSQCARAASAASERLLVCVGPLSSTSTTEVAVAVHALNRMLELGRPIYVRIA